MELNLTLHRKDSNDQGPALDSFQSGTEKTDLHTHTERKTMMVMMMMMMRCMIGQ